jgi:hypothetical protein
MLVPRFWSEASHREPLAGRRTLKLRRFGWSSTSQQDADEHARIRLEQALIVVRREGQAGLRGFTRRERRVAYNGADGLPIREEIVQEWEWPPAVLTRNSYGALCLNTPSAFFVDIDRVTVSVGRWAGAFWMLGAVFGAVAGALLIQSKGYVLKTAVVGAGVFWGLGVLVAKTRQKTLLQGRDPVAWARERVEEWCESHRNWLVRIYETPAGARLLVLHEPFDASQEQVRQFMRFVGADARYERMCGLQKCFRARVSPKPWRLGIQEHFKPGGTWPVTDSDKLARRAAWIQTYEARCRGFSSCRAVGTVGFGRKDAQVEAVRRLHDELSGAEAGLPLA